MLHGLGVDKKTIKLINAKGTNIGLQTIETEGTRNAIAGKSGFKIITDYRNIPVLSAPVLSAYAPVAIDGVH
jgi:methyl-accepting chemotaxis protein